ncbi:MAG TPA: serine hydroxymethyltransferase [Methylomirabilota bacterium]|nr:serine hydroxymethyltransferase [Methylomirabilota bacterium]
MPREIYFEHVIVGRHAKVTAIDSQTNVEVSVFGPASANPRDLETLALRKLQFRLSSQGDRAGGRPPPGGSRFA